MFDTTSASARTLKGDFFEDVTQRLRTEQDLRDLLNMHARVNRLIDLGHWSTDLATGETTWSDELFALARIPKPRDSSSPGLGADVIRCHAHPGDQERVLADLKDVLHTGGVRRIEYRTVRGDEPIRWVEMLSAREDDADGVPIRLVGTVINITERKAANEQLAFNARHDMLTGLANRRELHEHLTDICSTAHAPDFQAAVLFLDLDEFKSVNDTLGHSTGDLLLQSAAARLRALTRSCDLVSRNGGDEFVIVLQNSGPSDATAAARKIVEGFNDPLQVADRNISMGVSVGVACFPRDGTDIESLLRNADTAMYHAKRAHGSSFRMFEEAMHEAAVRRFRLEFELRHALEHRGLLVHYQPVVTIDGRLVGAEALVRWPHRETLIGAGDFVPLAEETGLIIKLDAFVLREACRQNASWQRNGRRLRIAVNVSAHSIAGADYIEDVSRALRTSGLDPSLLELELTESALQSDLSGTARKVAALRAMGVRVAIDDFGTGYNSLSILRSCQLDTLKLDRSFVNDIVTHAADKIIAESVIFAAHGLGARVVAEGVETEDQRATLSALRCDDAQGYLFGRATSPADFSALVDNPQPALPPLRRVS